MVYYFDMFTFIKQLLTATSVQAQQFGDSNIEAPLDRLGITTAQQIQTGNDATSFSAYVTNVTSIFVGYIGMAAVIVIIIAGVMLVASGGNEDIKARAQKIITYTIIGMLVVGGATAVVTFISNL